jgi:hypothetical protein
MLPQQTILRYSIVDKTLALLLAAGLVAVAVILWKIAHSTATYIAAVVVTLAAVFMLFMTIRDMLGLGRPRLIISLKGITTDNGTFYEWEAVSDERVERTGEHRYALVFTVNGWPTFTMRTDVSELTMSPEKITDLVKQYHEASTIHTL